MGDWEDAIALVFIVLKDNFDNDRTSAGANG